MTPTFTVLIGSAGRESLKDTLDSIARQDLRPGDLCCVGFDAFEKSATELTRLCQLVESYGPAHFRAYVYDSGYHWLGVEQINHMIRVGALAGSTHVFTLGDDDIFVDDAYATLRPICEADPLRPVLYQFLAPPFSPQGIPWRAILWDRPRLQMSHISGCCIAAPTSFVPAMTTERIVEHDYVWIKDIVNASGVKPLWLDEVLVIARPDAHGRGGVKHRGLLRCWACRQWRFREDVPFAEPYCPHCHTVLPIPGAHAPQAVLA